MTSTWNYSSYLAPPLILFKISCKIILRSKRNKWTENTGKEGEPSWTVNGSKKTENTLYQSHDVSKDHLSEPWTVSMESRDGHSFLENRRRRMEKVKLKWECTMNSVHRNYADLKAISMPLQSLLQQVSVEHLQGWLCSTCCEIRSEKYNPLSHHPQISMAKVS